MTVSFILWMTRSKKVLLLSDFILLTCDILILNRDHCCEN